MERVSNTSLFSSILSLSSALIRNVKNIDLNFSNDLAAITKPPVSSIDNPAATATASAPSPSHTGDSQLPGPWAFATSYYALGVVATAFILNRVQHIVVSPRRNPHRPRPSRGTGAWAAWHRLRGLFLPLDPSSTPSRLALNLPALYLLLRSLLLLLCTLLQVSDAFPTTQWLAPLGAWAAQHEMSYICWHVYGAVCMGLCCGALTQGLMDDGDGGNAMPFNLAAYAFLLHIYASPIAHAFRDMGPGLPSRPSRDVIITITLPALQITLLQLMLVKKEWANKRLLPTTICGLLSLAHFYTVVWSSPLTYPPLNFIPCVLTSVLIFVSLVTCTLNALTQLLSEGEITKPLFGHNQALPRWEDDFEIALLRLGTASLQATHIAGLSNQVAALKTGADAGGEVELSVSGVSGMAHPVGGRRGLAREYKKVSAQRPHAGGLFSGALWRELKRFGTALWSTSRGLWHWISRSKLRHDSPAVGPSAGFREAPSQSTSNEHDADELYSRFLGGDQLTDGSDDEEYQPGADAELSDASESDDGSEDEGGTDALNLYSDLAAPDADAAGSSAPGPHVLLAHMSSPGSGALTRRRYSRLMRQSSPSDEGWDVFVEQRRQSTSSRPASSSWDAESRRNCVICTVEARSIVCWPCRCLAMCDDCRANMASHFPASQHMCVFVPVPILHEVTFRLHLQVSMLQGNGRRVLS
ncbi:hypothetical protein EXIGLDRAFT_679077, partial [Exidia glandulosa HHB12029]